MKVVNENKELRVYIERDKLDRENASKLEEEVLADANQEVELVVIDLKDVKLVDSSGVGKILKLQSRLKEKDAKLKIVNVNDQYVQKLMNLVQLDKLVEIE